MDRGASSGVCVFAGRHAFTDAALDGPIRIYFFLRPVRRARKPVDTIIGTASSRSRLLDPTSQPLYCVVFIMLFLFLFLFFITDSIQSLGLGDGNDDAFTELLRMYNY